MLWDINEIQFARLIDEVISTHKLDLASLADEMDIELSDIDQLLDRANKVWEKSKADVDESHRAKFQLRAVIKENEKLEEECDVYTKRINELEEILKAREEQLTAKADCIKVQQDQFRAARHDVAAKLGLTCASTWEEVYDEVTNIRTKNGHLARELNIELEQYAKLDDVRYELEVKFKHLNDKHGILMANYHELEKRAERFESGEEDEPYLGDPPYTVKGGNHAPYQAFIHGWESAYADLQRAIEVGVYDPRIYDKREDDVTDAICKKFQNHGAK